MIGILTMNTKERKETISKAKELARQNFNQLPFEKRKKLANPFDRLIEIEALLQKGENLSMATIRNRKKVLEDWLIEWYREQLFSEIQ